MPAQSFPQNAVGACDAIRREVTDIGDNAPFNLGRATGALDFITDPQNNTGLEIATVMPSGGKKVATLRLLYDQRTKPCQVSTDPATNICTDTPTYVPRREALVSISKKITSPPRFFDNDDMVVLCTDMNEFIRARLLNDLRATRERLDEIILAEMNARVGKRFGWASNTAAGSYATLQLLATSGGQPVPLAGNYQDILMDYENMQFTGTPAIIGQGYFHKFIGLQKMACCNATTPYGEAIAGAGAAYYFDQAVNSVVGANKILVSAYGILHLLTFNKNNNINFSTPLEAHTVITDPENPFLKWNLDFKWDCTTERWMYEYSLHWEIFNVISGDAFGSDSGTPDCGDELLGVTGLWGYNVTNA